MATLFALWRRSMKLSYLTKNGKKIINRVRVASNSQYRNTSAARITCALLKSIGKVYVFGVFEDETKEADPMKGKCYFILNVRHFAFLLLLVK